jgi:mono/diheme cytochrome c family protein
MLGPMRAWNAVAGLLVAAVAAACSDSGPAPNPAPPPPPAAGAPAAATGEVAARGELLFRARVGGLACADCHATGGEDQPDPARRRVGHSLADATRRPAWWYGSLEAAKGATVADAALTCVARFQQRTWNTTLPALGDGRKDLSKVEVPKPDLDAIVAYLETFARPGPHAVLPAARAGSREDLARVEALAGDVERGKAVWAKACALCHGTGSDALGPSLRGSLAPDRLRVMDYCRMGPSEGDRRTADAWMPFFTRDALPDQDLADVAAMIDGQKW